MQMVRMVASVVARTVANGHGSASPSGGGMIAQPFALAVETETRCAPAMAYSRYIRFERAVILFVATIACALLTMTVGVGMIHLRLPPTDGAYDKRWFSTEVTAVAGPLCLVCAVIAYPLMLWGLLRTDLAKSVPVVFAVAVVSMAATAGFGPLGAGISLACSTLAMAWCRSRFRSRPTSQ